ncbi:MAG: hypothetical protein MHM6MM_001594 [Cercozoa sp. M6MM]
MRLVAVVAATGLLWQAVVVADQLVPLSIASPTCVKAGKCINDHGEFDSSVCCSGVCDKDNGCLSTTEATSVLFRVNTMGAPFICKDETFFGVLIGNGATAACSSRYWIGGCSPEESACVPRYK